MSGSKDQLTGQVHSLYGEIGTLGTELGRRNPMAVAMDLLFLFTVAFFALHLVRGLWPAVIGGIPLIFLLYFGYQSSIPFFLAQVITAVSAVIASYMGWLPL